MFSWSGATICIECQKGTFASSNSSILCLPCLRGTFSVITKATACSSCWSEGLCQSVTTRNCVPCNSLRFRANPAGTPEKYLCKYGDSLQDAEFLCTIPDHGLKQKLTCDYENSLSCEAQQHPESSSIRLNCQSSKAWKSPWNNSNVIWRICSEQTWLVKYGWTVLKQIWCINVPKHL